MIRARVEDLPLDRAPLLTLGEILVVRSGAYTGDSAMIAPEWVGSAPGYDLRITPGSESDARFMAYTLLGSRARDQIGLAKSRAAQPHLNAEDLGNVDVLHAPVSVQRAIADYLDRETTQIDALITAKRRMVELLEERLRAARTGLVVDRTNKERQSGPAWLGSIPTTWKLKRLKFVADMESGHTPNRQIEAYWIDCTIPWITLNDVSDLESGWRFIHPKNAVNELGLQNSSAHVLPENAVALSRDATVGRSALLGRPMAVSQHFVAWVCGPELMPEYLLSVFRGPMQHHFGSLTAGATIPTIGMPDLNQLVVPIPPIEKQERIVRQIAEVESLATETLVRVNRQVKLLEERRQGLITAAVTGQLDTGDADIADAA